MKNSIYIVIFFVTGIIFGYFLQLPIYIDIDKISLYTLYLLILMVGISVGVDKKSWKLIKNINFRIIFIPAATIIGTFIGVTVVSFFLPQYSYKESLLIGSGFGYYSLSSIMVGQLVNKELGMITLITNLSREIFTLLLAPFLVKLFGKLSPIVSGGATSMDTTLPIISSTAGKEYSIIAVIHGIVLTIAVPFIIIFLIRIIL